MKRKKNKLSDATGNTRLKTALMMSVRRSPRCHAKVATLAIDRSSRPIIIIGIQKIQ